MQILGFGDEALAAFIVFALGVLFTVIWQRYTDKKRRIVYKINRTQMSLNVQEPLKDRVSVSFDGQAVESLYAFEVNAENTGNLPVNDQIIQFEFSEKATPIAPAEYKHRPLIGPISKTSEEYNPYRITYSIKLLPVGQRVVFRFYTKNNQDDSILVYDRNETHPDTEIIEQSNARIATISSNIEQLVLLLFTIFFVNILSNSIPLFGGTYFGEIFAVFITPVLLITQIILLMLLFLSARHLIRDWFKNRQARSTSNSRVNVNSAVAQVLVMADANQTGDINFDLKPNNQASAKDNESRQEAIKDLKVAIEQVSQNPNLSPNIKFNRISKLQRIIELLEV